MAVICLPQEDLISVRKKLADDLPSVLNLRPLPALALRINEICQNQQSELNTVIELIQCEPVISSRILSVVNSPIYSYSREVNSIKQAVVVLGFKKLSEVAVSVASKQVFSAGEERPEAGMALYEHSLACATTARLLSNQSAGLTDDGAAFLAGLLHDVGKLFFFDLAPETYSALLETLGQDSSVEHEFAVFGKSHAQMGMHFAHVNGMPVSIRTAIEHHHANKSFRQSDLAKTVDLANSLVKTWGIGSPDDASRCPPNEVAMNWMSSRDEEAIDEFRENLQGQFKTLKSLFLD